MQKTKMENLRDVYAIKALCQIPRLLTLLDRNEFSKTYGSFQRTYWLDKSEDFVNALPQYGVHSLALVYSYKMPNNIYYKNKKIKKWAIAAMNYWGKVQHKDGSFDEFYPNEHGWAGPTGFLLYAMVESYKLIGDGITNEEKNKFLKACRKAAVFLGKNDESGVLANHHAIALLSIYDAYIILKDKYLLKLFHDKLNYFYTLVSKEGWSLEYDGPDMGYLSATVSFLSKLYKLGYRDSKIEDVIKKSIEFSSYFVYPNNYYAGSLGSRQTLHFYPHGYEIFAEKIPLAGRIADKMLEGLSEGKLVPPEIQADRYFLYRIPEFLLSYIDYNEKRKPSEAMLPYEKNDFIVDFKHAGIYVRKIENTYFLCNIKKGGIIKIFDIKNKKIILNDDGYVGKLDNNKAITSQWIDKNLKIESNNKKIVVKGKLNFISQKTFTPLKGIIFRIIMFLFGWNTFLSYHLKGLIRKIIIFGKNESNVCFSREIDFRDKIIIKDSIKNKSKNKITYFKIGGCSYVRYVPQSRFFQPVELEIEEYELNKSELFKFNETKTFKVERKIEIK